MAAPADTIRRLAEAAEREFAERGIDGASVRRIAAAAGQRNTNAVGYHFGSKTELVETVYELRQPMIDGRRGALLAELEARGELDVRASLVAIVQPFFDILDEPWGRRHLHFSRHYAHWLHTEGVDAGARRRRRAAAPNYVTAMGALESAIDAVDPATRAQRIELFEQLLPTTLGIIADDDRAGPHSADLLIDMYTAGLTAPTHERIH